TLRRRHDVVIPLDDAPPARRPGSLLGSVASLWSREYWQRTFALWTTWTAMNAAFSGPIVWLPFVLQSSGAAQPLQLSAFAGYAMLPGGVLALLLIDRFGRRPLMLGSLGVAAAGALLMALSRDPLAITAGGAALAGGALAAWPVALGWSSEQYPTRLRGRAAGWASGVARLGSIGAPAFIGSLLGPHGEGHVAALLPFGLMLLASVASVAIFARETANRPLEELSEPT
ncbi:MAG: MFS transporter, partial [Chloroflexota bacterium]|nr:MFS transporter [Chloroflexota bacterium]